MSKLSHKNRNDSVFCTECGESLKDVPVQDEKRAAAPKPAGAFGSGRNGSPAAQPITPGGGYAPRGGSDLFVDQSESVVAAIGNNYLQTYLSGGGFGKGIGILTQKRFYYKGKNFSGTGKDMASTTQEGVVSIEDITFTMFTYTRHIGLLLFAILLTIAGAVLCAMNGSLRAIGAVLLLAALAFYVLFFVNRQTLFLVSFPGGGFAFDIRYYPISDIRDFQRQLHLLKDHRKEG